MSLQGPRSGGTFADDATVGTISWTSPGNASAADGVLADASLPSAASVSHYLKATNFGFTIPDNTVITGITVEILRTGSVNQIIYDNSIKMVKGGTITGSDKANGSDGWSSIFSRYRSYGGSTDLWGATWTPADINASTFGVVVSAIENFDEGAGSHAYIDHIQITVDYVGSSIFGDARASLRSGDGTSLSF